jgi:coenzyme F420-reducing hydrogenase alpha subunit
MTTNDTNGYLPYDDDTFEKNLGYHDGYHDGYTEGERERMEELVDKNKEAFDTAIKQADDGQVTIAVRRQRDEHLLAEVSAAKNIAYDALERFADEKMDVESSGFDPIELADSIVEDLLKAGVVFPESLVDPHGFVREVARP